tara:strand:+ start:1142 stop:1399 length:258 start_codon:yes stop_codon:yes gene_type:complete
MSIILENQIPQDQRFTQKNEHEFNVFSTEVGNASDVEKWIGLDLPHKVLMDAETFARLRNRRIEWQFDDKKTLMSVLIRSEVKGE